MFVTSQTSATRSFWRILQYFDHGLQPTRTWERWADHDLVTRTYLEPEWLGYLHMWNFPPDLNMNWCLNTDSRWIVNFRDPRDWLCNKFFWELQHPTGESTPSRLARRARVRALGIDGYVSSFAQGARLAGVFNYFENALAVPKLTGGRCLVTTYAQLCLDAGGMIERMEGFLDAPIKPSVSAKDIESEMGGSISSNPKWIGQKWIGSDVAPGRFRRELSPRTQLKITGAIRPILQAMAELDPKFKDEYA